MLPTETSIPRNIWKRRWYSRMLASGPMYGPGSGHISSGVITLSSAISGRSASQSPRSKQPKASWTSWTYLAYPRRTVTAGGWPSNLHDDRQDQRPAPQLLVDEFRDVIVQVLLEQRDLTDLFLGRLGESVLDDVTELVTEPVGV